MVTFGTQFLSKHNPVDFCILKLYNVFICHNTVQCCMERIFSAVQNTQRCSPEGGTVEASLIFILKNYLNDSKLNMGCYVGFYYVGALVYADEIFEICLR